MTKPDTPAEVLKMAVSMSGGGKFKRWTRAERRYILDLLESTHCDPREMVLQDQRWIKLAHGLHSGEYGKKYPRAITALHMIRNGKVKSWYGRLEMALKNTLIAGLNVLSERPEEFVKRMSYLLTNFTNIVQIAEITQRFKIATAGVSNRMLYDLYSYLERRRVGTSERYRGKIKLPGQPALEPVYVDLIQGAIKDGLTYKLRKLDPLGKVWIDPELMKISLPNTTCLSVHSLLEMHVEARGEQVDKPEDAEKKFEPKDVDSDEKIAQLMGI